MSTPERREDVADLVQRDQSDRAVVAGAKERLVRVEEVLALLVAHRDRGGQREQVGVVGGVVPHVRAVTAAALTERPGHEVDLEVGAGAQRRR